MPKITSKLKKIDKGKPRRMTKKTPQESKIRKRPGYSAGGTPEKKAKEKKGPANPANKQQVAMTRNKKYVGGKPTGMGVAKERLAPRTFDKGKSIPVLPRVAESRKDRAKPRPGMVRGGLLSKSTKTNPKPMTATMQKKMPVETSRSKRPGFAHGGEMQILKPN